MPMSMSSARVFLSFSCLTTDMIYDTIDLNSVSLRMAITFTLSYLVILTRTVLLPRYVTCLMIYERPIEEQRNFCEYLYNFLSRCLGRLWSLRSNPNVDLSSLCSKEPFRNTGMIPDAIDLFFLYAFRAPLPSRAQVTTPFRPLPAVSTVGAPLHVGRSNLVALHAAAETFGLVVYLHGRHPPTDRMSHGAATDMTLYDAALSSVAMFFVAQA